MKHLNRRRLLAWSAGVSAAGAAGASLAVIADDERHLRSEAYRAGRAREPARQDPLAWLLQCAALAPSAHNTQPWRFAPAGERIELLADRARNLGAADAERRLMQLSLGCALENMAVAAGRIGRRLEVERIAAAPRLAADGHVATLRLQPAAAVEHPWFDAIFERRTARGPFDDTPVPRAMVEGMASAQAGLPGAMLHWLPDEAGLQALVRQSVRGYLTDARHRDGMAWFRLTRAEWERRRDGIAIFASGAPFVVQRYVEWFATERDLLAEPFRRGEIDAVDRVTAATPGWALVSAAEATPALRVQAGRLLQRFYLEATTQRLCVQPLCYPTEVPVGRRDLARRAGLPPGAEPLLLLRVGRGAPGAPSVRRDWRDLVVA